MIEAKLKSIKPDAEIRLVNQNIEHNFDIKLLEVRGLNYKLLFTDGLSKNIQKVKDGLETYEKIELYFCLPEFWNLDTEFWPAEWIDRVARVPQKYETWFGPGDTVPAGNPPQELSDRFPANHFMLVNPIHAKSLLSGKEFSDEKIAFLGLVPICQPELDYKLRNSATILLQRLEKKGHTEMVDLFRSSVCRRRILGF